MIIARFVRALLLTTAAIASRSELPAQGPAPLRVIRSTPASVANPLAEIAVTFDRPVAGSLDRSVDPATVLRIEPAVRGRLEWRDPVTIRLRPSAMLTAGTTYTVTIANTFRAMDGSALAEPYRFSFRAQGATLLMGTPVGGDSLRPRNLPLDQRFGLVYSTPVDLAKLSSAAFLEMNASCAGGARVIRLRATTQRPVPPNDGLYNFYDGREPDPALDSLRRIVQLAPETSLPRACVGDLVAPREVDDATRGFVRWPFWTHGDFRLVSAWCGTSPHCARGPVIVQFSTPVRGAEVLRHVKFVPEVKPSIRDTISESTVWTLDAKLEPRAAYAIVVDTSMRDVFGQPLRGNPAAGVRTTGFEPSVNYAFGHLVVERAGLKTLSVQHVNVDTLITLVAPIPDSLESHVVTRFGWANDTVWSALLKNATTRRIPLRPARDRIGLTGVQLTAPDARRPNAPTLFAVRVRGRSIGADSTSNGPIAVVQVTNLGVHARVGANDGAVWVTGVNDGQPKAGAKVVLYNTRGKALDTATTDSRGLARLGGWASRQNADTSTSPYADNEGYVKVTLGDDRAMASISRWDPDLSPWRFNVFPAWGEDRIDVAGTVFTERGIYRPGERVYAKAIIRHGPLGALRAPAAGDSIKWRFHDRDEGTLREITTRLTSFGTSSQSVVLPSGAAVGHYNIDIQAFRQGRWWTVGYANYRVAEYRPPEFLVDVNSAAAARMPGDTFSVNVQARYLFGAPMGRAAFTWTARQRPVSSWDLNIPGLEGWTIGESAAWWEEDESLGEREFASGADTLDVRGEKPVTVALPPPIKGRAANVTLQAVVADVNRQVVASSATTLVHPAEFYVAAKPRGNEYFWKAGTSQTIDVVAARPDGQRVSGASVRGTIVRREWHRVRRERDGIVDLVGDWVSDTVATCAVTTAAAPVPCTVTPRAGGLYTITFTATDRSGRIASTSLERWASGADWVPWNDESQFKMDVVPDKVRYSVGDTATLLFASPFTNAEAWITVEREGLIDQRRIRITSGSTTLKFPITEAYAPNAFVSILVTRGRSAQPGPLDDPGRPTIRVGYAQLRVTPEVKRLAVAITSDKPEYRPGDSARVRVQVRDVAGRGARSEVTLWAVDEGVLSLTGFKTPDPLDLIYRERGLGLRLASNLTSVAPQVPEGEKGRRDPGGGGGADGADILRSRFQTTAFFLATVVTDAQGNGVARVKLPDNITTFRVMAVAVTAGDRYGKGQSSMLVTRPLLARQALPRFIRPGDQFIAGAVINRRDGAAASVKVSAQATGVTLRGDSARTATLAAVRGAEVRFPFTAIRGDSATFRFDVTDDTNADAVRVSLPIRPEFHPRAHTLAGIVRDTATIEFTLPAGIDPARSRVSFSVGTSPLAMIRGIGKSMVVYPYYCTEQVISAALPLLSLYRAQRQSGTDYIGRDPRPDITRAVELLTRRQRPDGGIGYWSSSDWTSAWLSAYAGMVLLDARDVGVRVDTAVFSRLAEFLSRDLHGETQVSSTPLAYWYGQSAELRRRDQVAAVDFLSRLGRPDVASENELLRGAAMLSLEDRARLAEVLARRRQITSARQLMTSTWARVRVAGRRAEIVDSSRVSFYFESYLRPISRILMATLAVDPENALVGPLIETLVQPARAGRTSYMWNTQDYASAVMALAAYDRSRRGSSERTVRVTAAGRTLFAASLNGQGTDSSAALTGLLTDAAGNRHLRLSLDAGRGEGAVYYYATVTEIPSTQPVTPEDAGIRVERWYERFTSTTPVTSVAEGDLVRVRLRITVPATRQFVVLDDALPAGLEAIDLSLRTAAAVPGPGAQPAEQADHEEREPGSWGYGSWDSGWWSPFDHRELRDDRVVYSATVLWPGTYTATYIARATTPGTFIRPPAHAEEMYNPGVNGRSDGGTFVVTPRNP